MPGACGPNAAVTVMLHATSVLVAGWRVVPIDLAACGELARSSVPRIEQVFIEGDDDDTDAFERTIEIDLLQAIGDEAPEPKTPVQGILW